MELFYLILLSLSYSLVFSATLTPIVTTKDGKIQGIVKTLDDGTPVNFYEGIRFGKSSTGERRFAPPEPVDPWDGLYNATKVRNECMQSSGGLSYGVPEAAPQSEDCLFLSVYQPAYHSEKKRSVMFWIYGGAYTSGTIFMFLYDARYIAALGDVIVVAVNYRLGPYGFLSGDSDDAPGNVGLLDQLLGLKWTRDNIEAFGGDPNSITIFGESAGGMSVGALVLSPLASGLFKRAIIQSGAPNSYIGSESKAHSLEKTKDIADTLGCNATAFRDMIKCLRSKSLQEIHNYTMRGIVNGMNFIPIYGDKFLPIKPSVALREGKMNNDIEILFGTMKDEGSIFVLQLLKDLDPKVPSTITLSKAKAYINVLFTLLKQPFGTFASELYTSGLTDNDKIKLSQAIAASFGDFHITCPTILFGESFAHSKMSNKAYAYRMSYAPTLSLTGCSGWMGVCHGADLFMIFGFPIKLRGIIFNENDYRLSRDMINVWTFFAKNGHPPSLNNIQWPEAIDKNETNPSVRVMDLNPGKYHIISGLYKSTCDGFWKKYIG